MEKETFGRLIIVEGGNGAGKESQCRLLVDRLTDSGYKVAKFDFPNYQTESGKIIKNYLNGKYGKLHPEVGSALYALNRAAQADELMEALLENDYVICDRYVNSNKAFQGTKIDCDTAREAFWNHVDVLEYDDVRLPKPDLAFFLNVPVEFSMELTKQRGQPLDDHEKNLPMMIAAYNSYMELAEKNKDFVINCIVDNQLRSIQCISDEIFNAVLTS